MVNKSVYIMGKITGDPDYKAKFAEAERRLSAAGFEVYNPAHLPQGWTKAQYMRVDMAAIDACDFVVELPCVKFSKGANLEWHYMEYTKQYNKTYDLELFMTELERGELPL